MEHTSTKVLACGSTHHLFQFLMHLDTASVLLLLLLLLPPLLLLLQLRQLHGEPHQQPAQGAHPRAVPH
jgi:hypothetical protein